MLSGTILIVVSSPTMRNMPLTLDNDLPAAVFRFGATNDTEIPFSCHLDSCAAMNTGSLLLHMWITTTYPSIVECYKQYDDAVPFQPIMLDCAIPASEAEKDTGKFSAVMTYKTRYKKSDGNMTTISFSLGEAIKVNAILGLPTFRDLKLMLDVDAYRVTSKVLGIYFDLCFQHAATGFPQGVTFSKEDFVRPPRKTTTGLSLLAHCAISNTTMVTSAIKDKTIVVNIASEDTKL